MKTTSRSSSILALALVGTLMSCWLVHETSADCLADPALNDIFGGSAIPSEGSCCQSDVCNIPCPVEVEKPGPGYGVAVGIIVAISFALGIGGYFMIKGDAANYFVAGHSLNLPMVAIVSQTPIILLARAAYCRVHILHNCPY